MTEREQRIHDLITGRQELQQRVKQLEYENRELRSLMGDDVTLRRRHRECRSERDCLRGFKESADRYIAYHVDLIRQQHRKARLAWEKERQELSRTVTRLRKELKIHKLALAQIDLEEKPARLPMLGEERFEIPAGRGLGT